MKAVLAVFGLIILGQVFALEIMPPEIDKLVFKLGDDDFDIREKFTEELSNYPTQYAFTFRKYASAWKDPEIRWRLLAVSKNIWERKILGNTESWNRLRGSIGANVDVYTSNSEWQMLMARWYNGGRSSGGAEPERPTENKILGLKVGSIIGGLDSPAADKLEADDIITEINGESISFKSTEDPNYSYGLFSCGKTYKLKVVRKEQTEESKKLEDAAREKGENFSEWSREYKDKNFEVEIKAIQIDLKVFSEYEANRLCRELDKLYDQEWAKFINEYEEKYEQ